MEKLLIIIIGILAYNFLVIAHEFGHFWFARKYHMPIEEFSIGFPPRIYKRKTKKNYLFSIGLLPLGGFVKITGEELNEEIKDNPLVFANQSAVKQFIVLVSGVTINLLIGLLLIMGLLFSGMPKLGGMELPNQIKVGDHQLKLLKVQASPGLKINFLLEDSVAEQNGLKLGSLILAINGQKLDDFNQLKAIVEGFKPGDLVQIRLLDSEDIVQKEFFWPESNEAKLGVSADRVEEYRFDNKLLAPLATGVIVAKWSYQTVAGFFSTIKGIIVKHNINENVAGPVGIATTYYQAAQISPKLAILLFSIISLSLGIINLLPIPALDGGRIFILFLRKLGIKINDKFETYWHLAGFVSLMLLILIISIKDISRL